MLPSYFSAFFSHVLAPPIMHFPMPPIAPLRPPPREDTPASLTSTLASESPSTSSGSSKALSISTAATSIADASSVIDGSSSSSITNRKTSVSTRRQSFAYYASEGTVIEGSKALELHPMCNGHAMGEANLYMQLQRAVAMVLGVKEAMWEELKDMIDRDRRVLVQYGWEDTDFDTEMVNREWGASRKKFDAMVAQYQRSVMHFFFLT